MLKCSHQQTKREIEISKDITTAETFGMIAFASGIKAVPALDNNIMEMIENNPNKEIGASLTILKAWNHGWHKANCAK